MNPYNNYSTNCELLYRTTDQCRAMFKGPFWQCRAFVARWQGKIADWAIYKVYHKDRKFHNATDERFLEDHDDRYWHNVRFGQAAPIIGDTWSFYVWGHDRNGEFVREVGQARIEPRDILTFSRHYHDLARDHHMRWFRRDHSLLGGYFYSRDGTRLEAYPAGLGYREDVPRRP